MSADCRGNSNCTEPRNTAARSGLRDVASRFVKRANDAIDKGDPTAARDALRRARQADASLPSIRTAEARLSAN